MVAATSRIFTSESILIVYIHRVIYLNPIWKLANRNSIEEMACAS